MFDNFIEGFIDNCFKKKIKFFFDEIENRPVLVNNAVKILIMIISIYTAIDTIQGALDNTDTKAMLRSGQIPVERYRQIKELSMPNNVEEIIISNLLDKKYREESAKTITPLKNDGDSLELSSPSLGEPVIINNSNKKSFFIIDAPQEQEEDIIEEIQTIRGRINSINLDATKNKIGFKNNNEGNEIHCHLSEKLNINDYKSGYLGEWVEITGKVLQVGGVVKEIEISELKKVSKPGQIDIVGL